MNEKVMKRHYERTPKETLINILISSREQVEKLQNRNKERKQEIERLHSIIKEVREYIEENIEDEYKYDGLLYKNEDKEKLLEILDKAEE